MANIVIYNNGQTWTLQALTDKAAAFLGMDKPGEQDYSAEEAKSLCDAAKSQGLNVDSNI